MSKHEAEISPSAMLYRTVAIKKDNIPNSMLSRRPTPYYFDYTVVLHSHPSAIKTFISLNCSHYNRPDRIRQGLLSIFYQNRLWFLCNYVSSGMISEKFSYILCHLRQLLHNFTLPQSCITCFTNAGALSSTARLHFHLSISEFPAH